MKSKLRTVLTLFWACVVTAHAQPTSTGSISFQGALTDAGGQPLPNGNYDLTFKFYDAPTGGTAFATSSVPNVPVIGGIASTPIPVTATPFEGQTHYLGIAINTGQELSPRVLITTVPYAMIAQRVSGPKVDLWRSTDPEGGFWSLQPDAFNDGYFGIIRYAPAADWSKSLVISPSGNVGIGTPFPNAKLDVNGTAYVVGKLSAAGGLDVNGAAYVVGQLSAASVQIRGGADLAEMLDVLDSNPNDQHAVEPGMVVSIDPTGNRRFKLADDPYDKKRVGIISGGNGIQPGLILQDESNPSATGEHPIALTGQVWCHADASYGAIQPGDLLTTSSTSGHAMKVTDFDKARFAVLGQALTGLSEGRGWVQVLVGKQ